MKILLAIESCHRDRCLHQSLRDTWIKDIPVEVDYRIFSGSYVSEPDEIHLQVDDSYLGLPYKTRAIMVWALEHGYDYIYKCDADTLVCPFNLLNSGFEKYDYMGGMLICPDLKVANAIPNRKEEDCFVAETCRANDISLCGHPQFKFMPGAILTKGTISYHLSSVFGWRQDPKTPAYTPELMYREYAKFKQFSGRIDLEDWKGSKA